MSESTNSNSKTEDAYKMKGISVNGYVDQTGEFRWIPVQCNDDHSIKEIIDVLKKMPEDRREVWGKRLDREIMIARCPNIRNKPELAKSFDELLAASKDFNVKKIKEKEVKKSNDQEKRRQ